LIDTYIFEDELYLIKICIGIFICLAETVKERDINSIANAINNLHLYISGPEKIIREADKLKISNSKIADLKSSFRGRVSANF
jgi:hypothetical protein